MQCPNCGHSNSNVAQICEACGQALPTGPPPYDLSPIPFAPPPALPGERPVSPPRPPSPAAVLPYTVNSGYVVLCYVCGTGMGPYQAVCPRCGAPKGTISHPDDPTSSTFLPVGYTISPQPLRRARQEGPLWKMRGILFVAVVAVSIILRVIYYIIMLTRS